MDYRRFDECVLKVGGRFKLSVLVQKRVRELVRGAQPLIVVEGKFNPLDVAMEEILSDKVGFEDLEGDDDDILGSKEK